MSDDVIRVLKSEVERLERENKALVAENTRRKAANRELKAEADELRKQVAGLTGERDGYRERAEAGPTEKDARIAELEREVRTRDDREAWAAVVGDRLVEKATVDHLWRELDYKPGGDVLPPESIRERVEAGREKAPFLFKPQEKDAEASKQPPPARAVGGGRGERDKAPGRYRVTRAQMADPAFVLDPRNVRAMTEARAAGTFDLVD